MRQEQNLRQDGASNLDSGALMGVLMRQARHCQTAVKTIPPYGEFMDQSLAGMNIAVLLTDGFEQVEFTEPRHALEQQGAGIKVVSDKPGKVQGYNHDDKADQFDVDLTFNLANANDFDAVLLPGGKINGDRIRHIEGAKQFVQAMDELGKPVAAICHGSWLLAAAGVAEGRTLTSWPALQDDIRKAGGNWVDREVVVDGHIITSRKPDDIPAFNNKMIELIEQKVYASAQGSRDQSTGPGLSS